MHRHRGWPLLGAFLVFLLAPSPARPCDDVNVLVNPSGEAGPDPWDYVNAGSRLQVGPVTLSTGTVGATDGANWFAGEDTETAVSIGVAPLRVEQSVDVRGLPPIECIRLRADYFGVGEILAGSGTLQEIVTVRIDFYDDTSPNPIGAAYEVYGPYSLAAPFQELGLQVETTDIPAGTAFVVARMQGQMNLNSSVAGVEATGHAVLGADNAVMSMTLPEPGGAPDFAALCVFAIGIRRGRRSRRAPAGPATPSSRREPSPCLLASSRARSHFPPEVRLR